LPGSFFPLGPPTLLWKKREGVGGGEREMLIADTAAEIASPLVGGGCKEMERQKKEAGRRC